MNMWGNIKHYFCHKPMEWFMNMKWFFKNLWKFKEDLWRFRSWDFLYCLDIFATSLSALSDQIESGFEEDEAKMKKVLAINELILLLRQISVGNDYGCYDDLVNGKIKPKEYSDEVKKRKQEILSRINHLIIGQSNEDFDSVRDKDGTLTYQNWVNLYDGSGFEGWWE